MQTQIVEGGGIGVQIDGDHNNVTIYAGKTALVLEQRHKLKDAPRLWLNISRDPGACGQMCKSKIDPCDDRHKSDPARIEFVLRNDRIRGNHGHSRAAVDFAV